MAGDPDGNDDVLEFGETGGGGGRFRFRGRRSLVAAGVVVAGAAIAGSAVGVSAAAHRVAQAPVQRTAPVVKLNGIVLQEQSNGVVLVPAAAKRAPTGHVRCHSSP